MRWSQSSPSEETRARQEIGRVHLQRSNDAQNGGEQEPRNCGSVKDQHRQAGRRIDQCAFDALDVARRHFHIA